MKNSINYFFLGGIAAILILFFGSSGGCLKNQVIYPTTTDTIYVDKPYKEIVIKEVEVIIPTTVYVYKTDTVFRQKLEKDTLISGIEITPKKAKIHTITPRGLPLIKEYPLLPYQRFSLDYEGNLSIQQKKHPKRKKFFKTLGKIGIFVGGVWVGQRMQK